MGSDVIEKASLAVYEKYVMGERQHILAYRIMLFMSCYAISYNSIDCYIVLCHIMSLLLFIVTINRNN